MWGVDFKGWFSLGDGSRFDPLTISDLDSRYIVCCKGVRGCSHTLVYPAFKRVFKCYGLPETIRVDNGPPFASMGIGGLSRLSVWWILNGIRVEFIRPGHPEENGRHERMHRTLKAEAVNPASRSFLGQQRKLDRWRKVFNEQRPHEGIGMQRPVQKYQRSARRYSGKTKQPLYAEEMKVYRLSEGGFLDWCGQRYYVGEALSQVHVGLKAMGKGLYEIYFANYKIGSLGGTGSGMLRPMASTCRKRK